MGFGVAECLTAKKATDAEKKGTANREMLVNLIPISEFGVWIQITATAATNFARSTV